MSVNITDADIYLAKHLDAEEWDKLDDAKKEACLAMAENDVCFRLGSAAINPESSDELYAVYEQAVYLGKYYYRLSVPGDIESEKIDGIGSRSFFEKNSSLPALSPRALMFIRRMTGGRTSVSRG